MALNTLISAPSQGYQSYLLHRWKEQVAIGWRASLQNVSTHECHYFANTATLLSFLSSRLGQALFELDTQDFEAYRQASHKTPVFQPISKRVIKHPLFQPNSKGEACVSVDRSIFNVPPEAASPGFIPAKDPFGNFTISLAGCFHEKPKSSKDACICNPGGCHACRGCIGR